MIKRAVLPTLIVFYLVLPIVAEATTVAWYSEQEMVAKSTAIVRGTVLQVATRWQGKFIVTDIKIQVARVLKGKQLDPVVTMVQLGGELEGKTLHVPGTSKYRVGEEVLIFMEEGGQDLVEMGVGAGKYIIHRRGQTPLIKRQLGGVAFARVRGRDASPIETPKPSAEEPLAIFEKRILSYLGR